MREVFVNLYDVPNSLDRVTLEFPPREVGFSMAFKLTGGRGVVGDGKWHFVLRPEDSMVRSAQF